MKHLLALYFVLLLMLPSSAQNNKQIRQLRTQQTQLKKKIQQNEKNLTTVRKNVAAGMSNLTYINGKIEHQERTIRELQVEIDSITQRIGRLSAELKVLNRQLAEKRQNYQRSMLYLYNNRTTQNKLLFILSASNFSQMLRRYHYVGEYAKYQRVQGIMIKRKEDQARAVKHELEQSKQRVATALTRQTDEKQKLVTQQDEQKKAVNQLRKQEKQIQSVVAADRKQVAELDKKIDYFVQLALEQERKRQEEERRRQEATARKQQGGKGQPSVGKRSAGSTSAEKSEPMPVYKENSKEYKLGRNFSSNKGRLPVPINGAYVVSSHYGSNTIQGLKGVVVNNRGVNYTAPAATTARSVFDGEVSYIFSLGGLYHVLVRHGSYISLYSNLSSVSIKKGQRVTTKQTIGQIGRDASGKYTLHFELRHEREVLNPERWVAR